MEFGPSYDVLNVNSCQAKYNTTKALDNLNQVIKIDTCSVKAYFILIFTGHKFKGLLSYGSNKSKI